ncbi:MAG: hypothetical protein JJU00_20035 [Opitutales bacterium]|nr:hypothetical protein [Opitutales bacterium]
MKEKDLLISDMQESFKIWDSMSRHESDPEEREDMVRRRDAILERMEFERNRFREKLRRFDCFDGVENA